LDNNDNNMIKQDGIKRLLTENLVFIGIILLVVVTAIIEPKFLTMPNLANVLRQFGPLSLVSLGMTFIILCGFIDLSLGSVISLVAVVTVMLIDKIGQFPALLVGLVLGTALGYFNGALLIRGGAMKQANALFITFGLGVVYSAAAMLITGGLTQNMNRIEVDQSIFNTVGAGSIGFLPISFILFILCLVILYVFQEKTYLGHAVLLTGGNKTTAELVGIPTKLSIKLVYTIGGFMTAVGAVVLFSRVTLATPVMGQGFETNAILSVIVGGTSLAGGKGSVLRTMVGVMLVTLMSNCMNLLDISTYMQTVLMGAILIFAIWLDDRKRQ
jgi:ribose transport system permease protein